MVLPVLSRLLPPKPGFDGQGATDGSRAWPVTSRIAASPAGSAVRTAVQSTPATFTLARHKAQPIAAVIARLTITAAAAYLVAGLMPSGNQSVLAPLTALIVVQVTMFQTIRNAAQRVISVIAGVIVALGFSVFVGLTWWSLTILIAAGLAIGYALRLGVHILEVPISAMLILSLNPQTAAVGRIVETLIGAGVGMLGGLIFAPLRLQSAEGAIDDLSRDLAGLLEQIATDLAEASEAASADERLSRARTIDHEIQRVDRALAEAEDSSRMNPRARTLAHANVALRDGLETLEHTSVTVRGIARAIADSARLEAGPLAYEDVRQRLASTLRELAAAITDFGRLVRADILTGGEGSIARQRVEADLMRRLADSRQHEDELAGLVREEPAAGVEGWQLGGELLTHLSRLSDELQVEHRARARERWPRSDSRWSARIRQARIPLGRRARLRAADPGQPEQKMGEPRWPRAGWQCRAERLSVRYRNASRHPGETSADCRSHCG